MADQRRVHVLVYLQHENVTSNDSNFGNYLMDPRYVRSIHQLQIYKFPSPSGESVGGQGSMSPVSSQGPICRICHEGDVKEDLVAPCRCSGTMGLVHQSCIEKWLSSANLQSCEICKYSFATCKRPRPYSDWLRDPRNPSDLRNLAGDVFFFVLLTPLAAVSAYLCIVGAQHYASWGMQWEASGLISLALFLIFLYCIWCFVTVRYHVNVMVEWRRTHQLVKLVHMRRSPSSIFMMQQAQADTNNNGDIRPTLRPIREPNTHLAPTPRPLIRLRELNHYPWAAGRRTASNIHGHTTITTSVIVHSILHSGLPETAV